MGVRLREIDEAGELTTGEVARALGITKDTLRSWPATVIPFHRIGARQDRRYRRADVSAYIGARRAGDGRRRAELGAEAYEIHVRLEQIYEADHTLAQCTRVLDMAGRTDLARRLRHARSIVNELLNVGG